MVMLHRVPYESERARSERIQKEVDGKSTLDVIKQCETLLQSIASCGCDVVYSDGTYMENAIMCQVLATRLNKDFPRST